VEVNQLNMLQARRLLNNQLAQPCESNALSQAFKLLKDKEEIIYMDSKYAFGVAHTFGKV
jgi:hypothetical protein